jgi:hypothetical protein
MTEKRMQRGNLTWRDLGPIRVKTALDHVPKQPGLYKLTFQLGGKTYAYIGEAGARGLRARIRDYANNPTEGNKVEHLLHSESMTKRRGADLRKKRLLTRCDKA